MLAGVHCLLKEDVVLSCGLETTVLHSLPACFMQQHSFTNISHACLPPLSLPPDISQLGDPREVAKLLVPPGALVASVTSFTVAQPPKDTGTVLGTIQRDPVSYYK